MTEPVYRFLYWGGMISIILSEKAFHSKPLDARIDVHLLTKISIDHFQRTCYSSL